jgi:hypothetical protein
MSQESMGSVPLKRSHQKKDIRPKLDVGLSPLELMRIVPLREAARLSGLSLRTLHTSFRDKFVHLSKRRLGMRVRDALMLPPEA